VTDQAGTSLPRFKQALTDALQARVDVVSYQSPTQMSEVLGEDGSGSGVWWADDTTAEVAVNVMTGTDHWWDETVHPVLVIQCLGVDTDDTQAVLDARAANLLGHVLAVLASDPSVGVGVDADMRNVRAVPESWTYTTGVDAQNQRGARYELRLMLEARITVEAT
jgi:hypothetical protein